MGSDMWRRDYVRKGQETVVGRWLFGIRIETGPCDAAGNQGVVERVFVYQIASRVLIRNAVRFID